MEKRYLFDVNRNATGETIMSGENIPEGRYLIVVILWIQNTEGEFLIQKASKEKDGMWETTGGHLISHETSIEGIKREAKEELGIDIQEDIFFISTIETTDHLVDIYYLKKEIELSNIALQKEEVEEVRWMSIEEINQYIRLGDFRKSHARFFQLLIRYLHKKYNSTKNTCKKERIVYNVIIDKLGNVYCCLANT